jgi:hypothetical protein
MPESKEEQVTARTKNPYFKTTQECSRKIMTPTTGTIRLKKTSIYSNLEIYFSLSGGRRDKSRHNRASRHSLFLIKTT